MHTSVSIFILYVYACRCYVFVCINIYKKNTLDFVLLSSRARTKPIGSAFHLPPSLYIHRSPRLCHAKNLRYAYHFSTEPTLCLPSATSSYRQPEIRRLRFSSLSFSFDLLSEGHNNILSFSLSILSLYQSIDYIIYVSFVRILYTKWFIYRIHVQCIPS